MPLESFLDWIKVSFLNNKSNKKVFSMLLLNSKNKLAHKLKPSKNEKNVNRYGFNLAC